MTGECISELERYWAEPIDRSRYRPCTSIWTAIDRGVFSPDQWPDSWMYWQYIATCRAGRSVERCQRYSVGPDWTHATPCS
jgi:hypothetical protein